MTRKCHCTARCAWYRWSEHARRRRCYTEAFKARVVAACQVTGVSVAVVALEHQHNANLLRRWLDQAEGRLSKLSWRPAEAESTPCSVRPCAMWAKEVASTEIRVEVRRGHQ
ncbi:transposase [Caballeronia sp. INDeC2]|uniref:transposase n=1 Tax=Caballeronia sp. INDeC2 TaxID=2921747 RepID=UPI0032EF1FFE